MSIKTIAAAVFTALSIALAGVAWSQMDMQVVSNSFFVDPERPSATFKHDDHNANAEIDDCAVCHHVYDNGVLQEGEDSVGTSCAECHTLDSQGSQPGLMEAYHLNCKGCHLERDAGPVTCGACHKKENAGM